MVRSVMMPPRPILAFCCAAGVVVAAEPPQESGAKPKPQIVISADLRDPTLGATWLLYALAKWKWASEHLPPGSGRFNGSTEASFEEEAFARGALADGWKMVKEKHPDAVDRYLDDLLNVHEASFVREYVWKHLRRREWEPEPEGLRMKEFQLWKKGNLSHHRVKTMAVVRWRMEAEQ